MFLPTVSSYLSRIPTFPPATSTERNRFLYEGGIHDDLDILYTLLSVLASLHTLESDNSNPFFSFAGKL